MPELKELSTSEDILFLVNEFYQKVQKDETIGHIFTEIAALDFEHHIPLIADFWGSLLLGERKYQGNPMFKHIQLHQKYCLTAAHFQAWLSLWNMTVDAYFVGEKAQEAKKRAQSIADLIQYKLEKQ